MQTRENTTNSLNLLKDSKKTQKNYEHVIDENDNDTMSYTLILRPKLNDLILAFKEKLLEYIEKEDLVQIRTLFKKRPKYLFYLNNMDAKDIADARSIIKYNRQCNKPGRDRDVMTTYAAKARAKQDIGIPLRIYFSTDCVVSNGLLLAIRKGHLEIAKFLFEELPYISINNSQGRRQDKKITHDEADPLIFIPISTGKLEMVKLFLHHTGENQINTENDAGVTPLFMAMDQDIAILKYLIEKKAKIDRPNLYGDTALHCAARRGRVAHLQYLLDCDAKLDIKDTVNHETALHYAAKFGQLDVLEIFCNRHPDINAALQEENKFGLTPLSLAIQEGHKQIVEYLHVKIGLDLEKPNSKQKTSLHVAAQFGSNSILSYLLGQKLSLEARDENLNTPLMMAVGSNHLKTAKILLAAGAQTDVRNKKYSLFEYAVLGENLDLIKELLTHPIPSDALFAAFCLAATQATFNSDLLTLLIEEIEKRELNKEQEDADADLINKTFDFIVTQELTLVSELLIKILTQQKKRSHEEEFIFQQKVKHTVMNATHQAIEQSKFKMMQSLFKHALFKKLSKSEINQLFVLIIKSSPEVLDLFLNAKCLEVRELPTFSIALTSLSVNEDISALAYVCLKGSLPQVKSLIAFGALKQEEDVLISTSSGNKISLFQIKIDLKIKEYILSRLILLNSNIKNILVKHMRIAGSIKKIQMIVETICHQIFQCSPEFDMTTTSFILPISALKEKILVNPSSMDSQGQLRDSLYLTPGIICLMTELLISDPSHLEADAQFIEAHFWGILQQQLNQFLEENPIENFTEKLQQGLTEIKKNKEKEDILRPLAEQVLQSIEEDPIKPQFKEKEGIPLSLKIEQLIYLTHKIEDQKIYKEILSQEKIIEENLDEYLEHRSKLTLEIQNLVLLGDEANLIKAKELSESIARDSILKAHFNEASKAWDTLFSLESELLRLEKEWIEKEKKSSEEELPEKVKTHKTQEDLVLKAKMKRGLIKDTPAVSISPSSISASSITASSISTGTISANSIRINRDLAEQRKLLQQKIERRNKLDALRAERRKFFFDRQKRRMEEKLQKTQGSESASKKEFFLKLEARKTLSPLFVSFPIDHEINLQKQALFKDTMLKLSQILESIRLFEALGGEYTSSTLTLVTNAKLYILASAMEIIKDLDSSVSPFPPKTARIVRNVIYHGFIELCPKANADLKERMEFLEQLKSFISIVISYMKATDQDKKSLVERLSNDALLNKILSIYQKPALIPIVDECCDLWKQYSSQWTLFNTLEVSESILQAAKFHTYAIQGVIRSLIEDNYPDEFNANKMVYHSVSRKMANKIRHSDGLDTAAGLDAVGLDPIHYAFDNSLKNKNRDLNDCDLQKNESIAFEICCD